MAKYGADRPTGRFSKIHIRPQKWGFGPRSYTSRGPTDLSPSSFVVPMGTTKPPEMGSVGHREVSRKKISDPGAQWFMTRS